MTFVFAIYNLFKLTVVASNTGYPTSALAAPPLSRPPLVAQPLSHPSMVRLLAVRRSMMPRSLRRVCAAVMRLPGELGHVKCSGQE